MNFDELTSRYEKWLDLSGDPDLLRIVYGSFVANFFQGSPVWLIVLGPAGCGKSVILMSLSSSSKVYTISSLTPKALLSGYGNSDETSLIFKLRNKILIIKDLSSTTEIGAEDRGELFSILRDAYDGEISRATGRGVIRFEGHFGILAAGTSSLEQGRRMESMLGERFLYVRPRTADSAGAILDRAIKNTSRKKEMSDSLRFTAKEYLDNFKAPQKEDRKLANSTVATAREAAILLSQVRSSVSRDWKAEIDFPAEIGEVPTRIYDQMLLFAMGMKMCDSTEEQINRCVTRVMLDSIPYVRMKILSSVSDGICNGTNHIAKQIRMSDTHTNRQIEDMLHLGILAKDQMSNLTIKSKILGAAMKNGVRQR